jgi:hypothetical protein
VFWVVPFRGERIEDGRLELRKLGIEFLSANAFVAFCVVSFAKIGADL